MRKAINENPVVQMALLGALGILVAVVFLTRMGGDSSAPPEEATPSPAPATAVPGADPTLAAPAEATSPAPEAVAPSAAVGTPFEASKGLPAELVRAYESGDVVVLLVMQGDGYEDKSIKRDVDRLESRGDTSVFVADGKSVSKYSRIAEGVNLERTPAIIVLHPLDVKLARGEDVPLPAASVSYGYRGPESVQQTVRDALYDGKQLGYDPG